MTQSIINIITVLAFALAILTWLGITPQRLRELTKKHILKNWLTIVSIVFTCAGIALIILNIRLNVHNWWSYAEASWISIYFWLILIHTRLNDWHAQILRIFIRITPTMFLITSFGRLDNALKTGVFETTSLLFDKWTTLAVCGFYLLLVGFSLGMSMYFSRLEKSVDETRKKLQEIETKLESVSNELESIE